MLKKSIICTLAIILLSLCCTISLANEKGDYINLGNEIMRSIDKTENSMKNVVSGNVVRDAGNMVNDEMNMMQNGINSVGEGVRDVGNTVRDGEKNIENSMNNDNNRDSRNDNNKNNANSGVAGRNDGDYNVTRTSVDQTLNGGINTMTATTWMWIILIVAAVTIMAAIWYYATQGNK